VNLFRERIQKQLNNIFWVCDCPRVYIYRKENF